MHMAIFKRMYFCFVVYVIIGLVLKCKCHSIGYTNKLFVKIDKSDWQVVKDGLSDLNVHFLEEIFPSLYIFEYRGGPPKQIDKYKLQSIQTACNGKIQVIEQVRIHIDSLRRDPEPTTAVSYRDHDAVIGNALLACEPYFDMGVEDAWARNYTGHNIVVAVTDVGVDINIPDLEPNIAVHFSANYVNNNGLAPEIYPSYHESVALSDHGNRCSGLIAAVKDNDFCGAGIAYNAKLAVLKVFEVKLYEWVMPWYTDDMLVKALRHRLQDIHIFSNSWEYTADFAGLGQGAKAVLKFGTDTGRNGKGTIYVFPAGTIAEGFANSIYTIAVNSVGANGSIPAFAELCACALTSTYGEGSSFHSTHMVTTSYRNNCTRDFKGTSASTAMTSGIIALALEANPNLTWRDVQHIIVESSGRKGLQDYNIFNKNGAGKHYHHTFGFGLLNASKLVDIAINWKSVQPHIRHTEQSEIKSPSVNKQAKHISEAIFDIACNSKQNPCIHKIEHVVVVISYISTKEDELEIVIRSPSRTDSILMYSGQSAEDKEILREDLEFMSVHFWGEHSKGAWRLILAQMTNSFTMI